MRVNRLNPVQKAKCEFHIVQTPIEMRILLFYSINPLYKSQSLTFITIGLYIPILTLVFIIVKKCAKHKSWFNGQPL